MLNAYDPISVSHNTQPRLGIKKLLVVEAEKNFQIIVTGINEVYISPGSVPHPVPLSNPNR